MIARRKLPDEYLQWNAKWKAPFGRQLPFKILPSFLHNSSFARRIAGPFSYQPNNDTRTVEYPWAYFQSGIKAGQTAVDLGGGFSGFPFVLSKCGVDVTVVDPFLDYGPDRHYDRTPLEVACELNRLFQTDVKYKVCGLPQAEFISESLDVIFSVSVIEHLPKAVLDETLVEVKRILKVGGLFVFTVDMFLDLKPFTTRESNLFGCNQLLYDLVKMSGMELVYGNPDEMYGAASFSADRIQSNLSEFYLGSGYPVLVQTVVLRKV
ncbi:MAG: methyltransferase domain-containing protein [bacterium]|nr:methyltransferase domain-containing protein [bacterium]